MVKCINCKHCTVTDIPNYPYFCEKQKATMTREVATTEMSPELACEDYEK